VRNFIYTEFFLQLSKRASITLLTNIHHPDAIKSAKPFVESIIPLKSYKENSWVILFREIIHTAHYRWIWTEAVKYYWGRHNERVKGKPREWIRLIIWRILSTFFANQFMVRLGTKIDRWLSIRFRPTNDFDILYNKIKPDRVFNCSHIHGVSADLPIRVANSLKIPTSVFLFSWDNLSSRGRIFPEYNKYFVWTKEIKKHCLKLYKGEIQSYQVSVTGTPQFDFHFNKKYVWTKTRLFQELGLNLKRPYILYTTGMASDFPYEERIVEKLIQFIKAMDINPKPQLVVRTYIKGTSPEMVALGNNYNHDKDIFFPSIEWDKKWTLPLKHDIALYTNLLRYTSVGINTASTVSLELMMFNKPAINIGFEPPESNLPHWSRFSRHVGYEHYKPVVKGGGVTVARSMEDLYEIIIECFIHKNDLILNQNQFLQNMFSHSLDGKSSNRIVHKLNTMIN